MEKFRILFLMQRYPQISETYVIEEISSFYQDPKYECQIISMETCDLPALEHYPYEQTDNMEEIGELINEFKPHVMHTHYIHMIPILYHFAMTKKIPYTCRSHSYDVLTPILPFNMTVELANLGNCLGILCFPYAKDKLLKETTVKPELLIECYPVINYERFASKRIDPKPETKKIINVGAAISKKKFEDFIDLAKLMPEYEFNLYALGYELGQIEEYNKARGSPVNIGWEQPENMPERYAEHDWLVYTTNVVV